MGSSRIFTNHKTFVELVPGCNSLFLLRANVCKTCSDFEKLPILHKNWGDSGIDSEIGMKSAEIRERASIKSFHFGKRYDNNDGTIYPRLNIIEHTMAQCLYVIEIVKFEILIMKVISNKPLKVQEFQPSKLTLPYTRL